MKLKARVDVQLLVEDRAAAHLLRACQRYELSYIRELAGSRSGIVFLAIAGRCFLLLSFPFILLGLNALFEWINHGLLLNLYSIKFIISNIKKI